MGWLTAGGKGSVSLLSDHVMEGVAGVVGDRSTGGELEQATRLPTMASDNARSKKENFMTLILLEALLALAVLIAIVWWTMFSGRTKGERPHSDEHTPPRP